ncbi:FMN-binding protein [Amycolatopsis sp. K13G38]|uniref:FMN-binding protein n=1 Tax=Amycolatopsis acididurans TaxID=2724524 RepID=A0ABX1JC68_9PSEU|nr:FMN-binding protein [Amycolatopsis acididurans]NKQ57388.1 FMN-binding protein [Amycolatopsis acididurans]
MRRIIFFAMFAIAGLLPLLRYQPGVATPATSAIATAPPPSAPSSPAGGGTGATQIDGSTVDTEFGPYQVRVTFAGSKISDVQIITEPGDRHSQRIAKGAAPTLRQEALQAQNANIDSVSGATITSEAYAQSLQAALDAKGK